MKVKSAEFKTHLGKYLRIVEQESTALEICVRDRTVAYLVPANAFGGGVGVGGSSDDLPLMALKRAGMKVEMASGRCGGDELGGPVVAGDGREDVVTVDRMRQGRDW